MYRRSLQLFTRQLVLSYAKGAKKLQQKYLYSELIQPVKPTVPVILTCRDYSKGKSSKKDKKKSTKIFEEELAEVFDKEKLFKDIMRPLDLYKQDLTLQASLRSSQGVIENLKIEFEGSTYTIQDLAEIGKKNPRLYVLDLSEFPQSLQTVMKCLQNADLNLNPQMEGTRIFVPIPVVSKEHRKMLLKKAKSLFVKCKQSIRDVQNQYIKKLSNVENISDETKFRLTDQLTSLGDKYISTAEQILKEKEGELLEQNFMN